MAGDSPSRNIFKLINEAEALAQEVVGLVLRSVKDEIRIGNEVVIEKRGENDIIELPYYLAKVLEEEGHLQLSHEQIMKTDEIQRTYWKEVVESSTELTPISEDFYIRAALKLRQLAKESEVAVGAQRRRLLEELEKLKDNIKRISDMRLRKIMNTALYKPNAPEVMEKLSAEERVLYVMLSNIVLSWRDFIESLLEV